MIEFVFEDTEPIKLNESLIQSWIAQISEREGFILGDITYIFCSDNYILNINKEYLNHDYFTDIITFNYNEGNIISGDLFISLDTVLSNSELFKTKYDIELHRVIIHGILHLIGYNDKTDAEQEEMTQMENSCLDLLKTIS